MTGNYELLLKDLKYDVLIASTPTYEQCMETLKLEKHRFMSLFGVTALHYVIIKNGRVFESAWV